MPLRDKLIEVGAVELEFILAFVTALGLREIAPKVIEAASGRRKQTLDELRAFVETLREDNKLLRAELAIARREARRANRRIDLFLHAVRECPNAANCPVLAMSERDIPAFEDDEEPTTVGG